MCRKHGLHRPRPSDPPRDAPGPAFEQKRVTRYLVRPGIGMLEHDNRRNAGEDRNGQLFKRAPGSKITHDDSGQVAVGQGWVGEAVVRPSFNPLNIDASVGHGISLSQELSLFKSRSCGVRRHPPKDDSPQTRWSPPTLFL